MEDRISALTTRDPNKLKVYTDGYDGHSLRAYSYWPDSFTYIRQALPTERCFKIIVNGEPVYGKQGDIVTLPDGSSLPIETYYEQTNSRL